MNEMKYPFPTAQDDELAQRFGIEPVAYTPAQLEHAATAWQAFLASENDAVVFVQLLSVCEGSATEATILWDALKSHRTVGLHAFLDRPSSYYGKVFQCTFLGDRRCRRAYEVLSDLGLIIEWPTKDKSGHKFRIDWIRLSIELGGQKGQYLPGLLVPVGEQL
jgi:hypothetical protein